MELSYSHASLNILFLFIFFYLSSFQFVTISLGKNSSCKFPDPQGLCFRSISRFQTLRSLRNIERNSGTYIHSKVAFLKFLRISRWKNRSHHLFSRYLNYDTKNLTYTPLVFLIHALLDFYYPKSVQYFHQSTLKLCYDSPSK